MEGRGNGTEYNIQWFRAQWEIKMNQPYENFFHEVWQRNTGVLRGKVFVWNTDLDISCSFIDALLKLLL